MKKPRFLGSIHTISFKLTLGFLLLALLITLSLSLLGYQQYKSTVLQLYGDHASSAAQTAARMIDGDRVNGYLESGETDDAYDKMAEKLDQLREDAGLQYLYTFVPDEEFIRYIYEAHNDYNKANQLGDIDGLDPEGKEDLFALMETGVIPETDYDVGYDEHYGYTLVTVAPVFNSENKVTALVTAEICATVIDGRLQTYLLVAVGVGAAFALFMILIYLAYLRKRVTQPLHRLTQGAADFAQSRKGFDNALLNLRTGDEVESLAQSLGKMAVDINRYIQDLTAATAEKERVTTELAIATQIQSGMLPCTFPAFPDRDEFDIYGYMRPAKAVGGDFYDFFFTDENHLCIVIADVSGKGVPAALFMMITKTLIKNYAQAGFSPAKIFERVNTQLCENNDARMFVTAFLGILDLHSGSFTYANAGHNPPIISNGEDRCEWLTAKRCFVLAGRKSMPYKEQTITLNHGDRLFLYTDGVTEAMNTRLERFTDKRLLSLFQSDSLKGLPMKEIVQKIDSELTAFADGEEQSDDITMLLLRIL